MYETIARELETRFGLGNKSAPFVRMLMAHMTDPDRGGLNGFIQRLRDAQWTGLEGWMGRQDLAAPATVEHVERAFGATGGLIGAMMGKLGLGRDLVIRALGFAVPALLGRLTPGGTVPTALAPDAVTYIGDRREWALPVAAAAAARAAPAAVAPVARTGMGMWPWILAAIAAALLLGFCAMNKKPAKAPDAPAQSTVPAPSGNTPPASVQATEEPAGAGILDWRLNDMPALKVYFDSGSTQVASEFGAKAKPVVDYLNANAGTKLAVSGFNDPTGDPVKNAELSKSRAEAVKAALVAAGAPADRVDLVKPVDTTGTATTNAASRRVEVTVVK